MICIPLQIEPVPLHGILHRQDKINHWPGVTAFALVEPRLVKHPGAIGKGGCHRRQRFQKRVQGRVWSRKPVL